MEHEQFIRKAIELAIESGKKGNYTFGAVLVHKGAIVAEAENTQVTGDGYGHAEYNLAIKSAQTIPDEVLRECTLYTSTSPCPRCTFSILAIGVRRVVICVSQEAFARLFPGALDQLSIEDIVSRLGVQNVEIVGPVLEEEGMRAYEHWAGKYRPLEQLLESARQARDRGNG